MRESVLINSLIRYCDIETKDDRLITLHNSPLSINLMALSTAQQT